MGRKAKKHEHVNHERWLVSYADFITLLFAFFVVMFAVSQVDSKKLGRFAESASSAFHVPGVFSEGQGSPLGGGSTGDSIVSPVVSQRPSLLPYSAPSRKAKALMRVLEDELEKAGLSGDVGLRDDPRGVVLSLPEHAFFYAGVNKLRPAAVAKLRTLASLVAAESAAVQIEAHTDGLGGPATPFPSTWELSAARAARIASFLQEAGVAPERLSATGFGQYHTLADGSGSAGAESSWRVDLVLVTGEQAE